MMQLTSQLKVLSVEAMETVHQRAVELLQRRGVVFQSASSLEIFRRHNVKVSDHTVFFDRAVIDRSLAQCPGSFRLEAPNPQRSVTVGEGLLIHPAGGEVYIEDYEGGRRSPTLRDFGDLQKIYQASDAVDIAGYQPLSPRDVPDATKGLHCVLEAFKHSDKPLLSPMELDTVAQKEDCLDFFELAFGHEGYLEDHYVTWHAVCSNSPFYYSDFACEGIEVYARRNQPVLLVSAPMTGITGPVGLYGTVVLALAELLAGLVLAQLVRPGVPVIPSASLTYGNLRYATWECASPDTALLLGALVQMFNDFYHLPSRAQTGVTSSKLPDFQAGMETMQSFMLTALAGVNLCSQSVGALANLMTCSPEKTVLDCELIQRVRYLLRGMDTQPSALAWEELLAAAPRSDFMTSESTLAHFREGWQPAVSDWQTPEAWEANRRPDALRNAHGRVQEILAAAPSSLLDAEQEKLLSDFIRRKERP